MFITALFCFRLTFVLINKITKHPIIGLEFTKQESLTDKQMYIFFSSTDASM